MLHIAVLAGTTRQSRMSIHAAKYVAKIGKSIEGLTIDFVDPVDLKLPNDGANDKDRDPMYSKITAQADAFVIVTPEYNHSIPGSLKRMLDSEYDNYKHKAVALVGVSSGQWGGVRAIESLSTIVRALGLVTTKTDMQFPNINKQFDHDGKLLNDNLKPHVIKMYKELIWLANSLKWGRENL